MADERIWGLSKKDADYGRAPSPAERCDRCRFMLPKSRLGTCKLVRGLIRAEDSCRKFLAVRVKA